MQTMKRVRAGCLLAIATLVAGVAEAAPEGAGVFFGVSGGSITYDQDSRDYELVAREAFLESGLLITSLRSSFDDSDTTFAVFGGYRFNRYIAVEGGYLDLGEVTYSGTGTFRLNFFQTLQ